MYACAINRRAFSRTLLRACARACACMCVRLPATRSETLPHTLAAYSSLAFSRLYATMFSIPLLFLLVARASSHSRLPGRSLSHSHPFTLDLKMRPIGCPKLFFFFFFLVDARRPSLMKSYVASQRREIESVSEGRPAKAPQLSACLKRVYSPSLFCSFVHHNSRALHFSIKCPPSTRKY